MTGPGPGVAPAMYETINSTEPSHSCPVCHDAFGDEQSLARHAARSHARENPQRGEPLQCAQCPATLANSQNLRRHVAVCHSGDRSTPTRKGATGAAASGVVKTPSSSRKPKNAKVFICPHCPNGTTFRWKGNLKRHHQLIHLQAKPYKCEVCNESFGTKGSSWLFPCKPCEPSRDFNRYQFERLKRRRNGRRWPDELKRNAAASHPSTSRHSPRHSPRNTDEQHGWHD
jgi:uncharacterized C2H2 Zn-finger protein